MLRLTGDQDRSSAGYYTDYNSVVKNPYRHLDSSDSSRTRVVRINSFSDNGSSTPLMTLRYLHVDKENPCETELIPVSHRNFRR